MSESSGTGAVKPSEKHPAVEALITRLMKKDRRETIGHGLCMTCDGKAERFRDTLSLREYTISGMCQKCQDRAFSNE